MILIPSFLTRFVFSVVFKAKLREIYDSLNLERRVVWNKNKLFADFNPDKFWELSGLKNRKKIT